MRLPIRVRMTAWYIALLGLIIAGVGAFLVLSLHADLIASMDRRLNAAVDQIALGYHNEGSPEVRDVSATVLSGEVAASQVLSESDRVRVSFGDVVAKTPMIGRGELRQAFAGIRVHRTAALGSTRRHFRIVAQVTTRGADRLVVVAGESTTTTDHSVRRLLTLLLLALPAAIAATAAGGWWLATRALRPIGRLTSQARQIGVERLSERLPVPAAGDEVARLADTLNTMLARIEASVDEQHRLVADASHELRSPLAAMRAELEVSLRGDDLGEDARNVLRSTLEEVMRMSATIDGLLVLASADRGALDLRVTAVDVATITRDAVERLRVLAASRDVTLELRLAPALASGDAERIGQAIGNLLDNAIKFSPAGGTVTVASEGARGEALVRVQDEGPGIPAHDRERVFDRFFRVDASRSRSAGGSGIGLSIVREIARAHGGRAWAEPGRRRGSVFTFAVPAASEQAGHGPTDEPRVGIAR